MALAPMMRLVVEHVWQQIVQTTPVLSDLHWSVTGHYVAGGGVRDDARNAPPDLAVYVFGLDGEGADTFLAMFSSL